MNPSTGVILAKIPVGGHPFGIAANPNNNRIYVANFDSKSVSVIDGSSNAVIETVDVGANPAFVAIDSSTNMVYVSLYTGAKVVVIDPSNQVVASLPTGNDPYGMAVNPFTHRLYVTTRDVFTITIFDTETFAQVGKVSLAAEPFMVAVNPTTNTFFATTADKRLTKYDGSSNAVIGITPLQEVVTDGMAVDPTKNRVYLSFGTLNRVSSLTETCPPTPTPTFTPSLTPTPTPTFTATPTSTPTRTFTPTPTLTPTRTFTPSPTSTSTFTPTPTRTFTPTPTSTFTPTPTSTFTPTFTPTPTVVPLGNLCFLEWNDWNGNGVRDGVPLEPLLTGTAVSVYSQPSNALIGSWLTNGSEPHCFRNLAAGTYLVVTVAPSGYSPTTQPSFSVQLAGNQTIEVDFGAWIQPTATPTNTRVPAPTNTPTPTSTPMPPGCVAGTKVTHLGQPVQNLVVTASWVDPMAGSQNRTTTTDASGAFRFDNLTPDIVYTIAESVPAGWAPIAPSSWTVTVESGANCAPVAFVNQPPATATPTSTIPAPTNTPLPLGQICALVYHDQNINGQRNVGEPLLTAALVTIQDSNGVVVGTRITNGTEPWLAICNPGSIRFWKRIPLVTPRRHPIKSSRR